MLQRYLLIWLCLSSLLAFKWPDWISQDADPFMASKPAISLMIATIMFAVGWLIPQNEIQELRSRWPQVLIGTVVQYVSMPILAYCIAKVFQLEGDYLVGAIVVGCVPGAMASNVLTLNAKGNVSYSVCLTAAATILSPLIVPLVLKVALQAEDVSIDVRKVSVNLFLTVVLPVVLGHLLSRRAVRYEKQTKPWALAIANLTILWIIAVVVALNRDSLAGFKWALLAALLIINVLGYAVGYSAGWASRMPEPMRRALTIEIGMQNAGLGATLAATLFPDRPEIAIAPAIYTFGCMLTGTVLAWSWSMSADALSKGNSDKNEVDSGL